MKKLTGLILPVLRIFGWLAFVFGITAVISLLMNATTNAGIANENKFMFEVTASLYFIIALTGLVLVGLAQLLVQFQVREK